MASKAAQAAKDRAQLSIQKMGWTVGKFLGEGAFGKVYLVSKDGLTAACKIIEKPRDQKQLEMIYNEISVMKAMNHPYIVKCHDAFQTDAHFFLFLELMTGGELFDKIVELGQFTEAMAASVAVKVLISLRYVHAQGIVHRDLKPENLLLANKEPNSPVKLVDFGLSAMYDAESAMMTDPAGTPGYQAPEVLMSKKNGGYDQQVDVWSFGVIIYILLSGTPPFFAATAAKETAKIVRADYSYPDAQWKLVSKEAKAFIDSMLVVDPAKRATVAQLLKDPWLADAVKFHNDNRATGGGQLIPTDAKGPNLKANEGYDLKATEAALAAQAKFASTWNKMKAVMALQAAGKKGLAGVGAGADKPAAAKPAVDISDSGAGAVPPSAKAEEKKEVKFANSPGKPPPLPRGWSAHISKDGSKYWYSCDADAKDVQWEVPSAEQAVETELPAGWTAHHAKDGKRWFYWNATSKQTMWEIPGPERACVTKLPRGWSVHLADDKVHFYYFCDSNGKTQWEVPELWQATAKPTRTPSSKVTRQQSQGTFVRRVSTARPAVRQYGR